MRTSFKTLAAFLCGLLLRLAAAQAAEQQNTKSFIYTNAKQADLELVAFAANASAPESFAKDGGWPMASIRDANGQATAIVSANWR